MSSRRERKRLERALATGRKRRKAVLGGVPKPKLKHPSAIRVPQNLGARETSRRLRRTARRKPWKVVYTLRDPLVYYVGVTNKPPRRVVEHRSDGKTGVFKVETHPLPPEEAFALERKLQEDLGLRSPRDREFRTKSGSKLAVRRPRPPRDRTFSKRRGSF